MNIKVWSVVTGLLLGTVSTVDAQTPVAPRELGMGGAYVGVARGYEALFLSPGNLGLGDKPRWSIGFPQVALGGSIAGPRFGDLRELVDYHDLSTERQSEILSLIPSSGAEAKFSMRAPLAAISIGGFGVGLGYASVGSHTVSKDMAELILQGYEEGRSSYHVGETTGERASYWDFAAGYSRSFGSLSIGAVGHYLPSGTLVRSRLFEPRVNVAAREIEVDYVGVISRGGSGYSVDLGLAYSTGAEFTMSAALSNAFSKMSWSEDLHVRTLTLDRTMIESATPLTILDRYERSEAALAGEATPEIQLASVGLFSEAQFPMVGRLGIEWSPAESTQFAADFHRKISDGKLSDAWDQRLAIGVQQSLPLIDVRAGYAVGTEGANLLGGGISLGPLDLGIARYRQSEVNGSKVEGWIATMGLGVHQPF